MKWKNIKGYEEKYMVSDEGQIKNIKTGKFLKHDISNKWKYHRVRLYKNDKGKHYLVHRLVAENFIANPNNFPEVNHKDKNKSNNGVSNLEWCTSSYNSRHSRAKIVSMYGTRGYLKTFSCIREAAKSTGIDNASIVRCCKGKQNHAGGFIWKYNDSVD